MEIKTCEQYVLAQLFDQQDENDMLNRELKYRDERIDELTGQIDAIESAGAAALATYGYCGSSNIVRAVRTGCKAGGHYWKRADEEDK